LDATNLVFAAVLSVQELSHPHRLDDFVVALPYVPMVRTGLRNLTAASQLADRTPRPGAGDRTGGPGLGDQSGTEQLGDTTLRPGIRNH
jgi:hypothetical protein